jgi:hypothetical protein
MRSIALLLATVGQLHTALGWASAPRSALARPTARLTARRPVASLRLDGSGGQTDIELAKCDMAVLAIYSLGQSCVEIVATGEFKSTPSFSPQDLVDITQALNEAASSACGWLVAATLLAHTGILARPLEREPLRVAANVLGVFLLAGPLDLALGAVSLSLTEADGAVASAVLTARALALPVHLLLLIGWRAVLAPSMMF